MPNLLRLKIKSSVQIAGVLTLTIRQASIADIDLLVPLFDAYRQFYNQPSDLAAARAFLALRFEHQQSVIFIAFEAERALGFTQLYPSFSSTRLTRMFVLNDLYVSPDARGLGAGNALLDAACAYGRKVGASQLSLRTATDNATAQALYERAGWVRDTQFFTYGIAL